MQKEGAENLRIQRIQVRAEEIFEKDLVHKFEFQHNCDEVSEAIAQHLIGIGFEIGTQSNTKVVTDKRYNRDYSGARVIMVVLHPVGAGCQMQGTQVDSWGGASESTPATKVELAVIEALEPEKLPALRAEAKKRAEAENPPEAGTTAVATTEAAAPPEPAPKPKKEKAAGVATAEGAATAGPGPKSKPEKAAPTATAEAQPEAGASEEEAAQPPAKKPQQQKPVKKEAEASSSPPPVPPAFELAVAPIVALNRSLSFVDQKTSMINPSENNMRPYTLGYGPAVALHLVWYPLGAFTDGFARNIGLEGGVEQGFSVETTLPADDPTLPNARFGTTLHEYAGGLRVRIPFGDGGHHAWISVTGGEQAFVFNSSSTCALTTPNTCRPNLNTPDTIYHYLRPGIGARFELGAAFAFAATAGFRYTFDGGGTQFSTYFPHHTAYGLDAGFYLGYRVVPSIEIRLGGDLRRYVYAMHPTMADAQAIMAGGTPIKVAEGATDRYLAGTIGVAFLYGGAPVGK